MSRLSDEEVQAFLDESRSVRPMGITLVDRFWRAAWQRMGDQAETIAEQTEQNAQLRSALRAFGVDV